jgi:hypothetical protein
MSTQTQNAESSHRGGAPTYRERNKTKRRRQRGVHNDQARPSSNQDDTTYKHQRAGPIGERKRRSSLDLRDTRRGETSYIINTCALLLNLEWVLISTITLCDHTHHNALPPILTSTIYPPSYHLTMPSPTIYPLSCHSITSLPTKPPHEYHPLQYHLHLDNHKMSPSTTQCLPPSWYALQ